MAIGMLIALFLENEFQAISRTAPRIREGHQTIYAQIIGLSSQQSCSGND